MVTAIKHSADHSREKIKLKMAENKRQSNSKVFQLISHFEDLALFKKPIIKRNPFKKRRQVVSEYSEEPSTPTYLKGAQSVDCFSDVFEDDKVKKKRYSEVAAKKIDDVPAKSIEYLEQQFLTDDIISVDETIESIPTDNVTSDKIEEYRRRAKEEEERYRQSFLSEFSEFDDDFSDVEETEYIETSNLAPEGLVNVVYNNVPIYNIQKDETTVNKSQTENVSDNEWEERYDTLNLINGRSVKKDESILSDVYNVHSKELNEDLKLPDDPLDLNTQNVSSNNLNVPNCVEIVPKNISCVEKVVDTPRNYTEDDIIEPTNKHIINYGEYVFQNRNIPDLDMSQFVSKPIIKEVHKKSTNEYISPSPEITTNGDQIVSGNDQDAEIENKPIAKKNKKQHIVDELIESELKYLEQLRWLTENYLRPLLRRNCTRSDIDIIFTNITDIYEASQMFVMNLQECQYSYVEIGKVFYKHRELFEKYPKYCKNRRFAYHLITGKYKEIIKALQIRLDDKLGLNSSLLKPVQRLAKYELLLINLSNDLIQDGTPCQSIQNAITMIQNIARVSDVMVTLETIKRNPFNYKSLGDFLLKDKFKLHQPEKHEVVVFLFKRIILFTEEIQDVQEEYRYKSYIPMKKLRQNWSTQYGNLSFGLEYYVKKKKNTTYVLEAVDDKVKAKWIQEIGKILWSQLEKAKEQQMNNLIKKLQEDGDQTSSKTNTDDNISATNNENSDVDTETGSYEHLFQGNNDTFNPKESKKTNADDADESQVDKTATKKRSFRKKEKPKVKENKTEKSYALKSLAHVYSQWPNVH